ncbi:aminopeptidase N [Aphis craccivora]|uniref:Aminopeptidase N n=1 Tax=Aphis craccivora TaxID=307492 RepID=A0A6G0Y5H1_APHCR|nr:aminopeptidase N [Aphis craccivora]
MMYVIPVLTYADAAWAAPLTSKVQWNKLEAVQNIGLSTTTNCPFYVQNDVLRSSARLNAIQGTILNQTSNPPTTTKEID